MKQSSIFAFIVIMANINIAPCAAHQPFPDSSGKIRDQVELYMFPGWYEPRRTFVSHNGAASLLLQFEKNGRVTLFQQKEPWPVPNFIVLKGLSFKKAQEMWGPGHGTEDEMTFDLITDSTPPEKDIYHLDTKFVKGLLTSYRFRGIRISQPEWMSVDQ